MCEKDCNTCVYLDRLAETEKRAEAIEQQLSRYRERAETAAKRASIAEFRFEILKERLCPNYKCDDYCNEKKRADRLETSIYDYLPLVDELEELRQQCARFRAALRCSCGDGYVRVSENVGKWVGPEFRKPCPACAKAREEARGK